MAAVPQCCKQPLEQEDTPEEPSRGRVLRATGTAHTEHSQRTFSLLPVPAQSQRAQDRGVSPQGAARFVVGRWKETPLHLTVSAPAVAPQLLRLWPLALPEH